MHANRVAILSYLLSLIGCDTHIVSNFTDSGFYGDMQSCSSLPDLLPSAPKCAAAKGLSGDNLICVDFNQVSSLVDQKLAGWFFGKDTMSMDCWELAGGKLQIKNFANLVDTCLLKMQTIDLNDADKQKYQSLTLSIIQRVDINNPNQTAQAALGSSLANRTF